MSLGSHGSSASDPVRGASWPCPGAGMALLRPLSQLGPVLLVCGRERAAAAAWRLRTCIDSDGVQECLELGAWRVYRLPDSDFLGWDRLGSLCRCEGRPGPPSPQHAQRASLAVAGDHGWEPVRRISAMGWEVARRIVQREAAILCAAAWRD